MQWNSYRFEITPRCGAPIGIVRTCPSFKLNSARLRDTAQRQTVHDARGAHARDGFDAVNQAAVIVGDLAILVILCAGHRQVHSEHALTRESRVHPEESRETACKEESTEQQNDGHGNLRHYQQVSGLSSSGYRSRTLLQCASRMVTRGNSPG